MSTFIQFAIVGLGTGALYALVAQGIVLIYRSSGVINFAQGATAALGGYVYYELNAHHGAAPGVALIGATLAAAILGAAIQLGIMRPLRGSSPLTKVIATTGVLTILVEIGYLHYGASTVFVTSFLPDGFISLGGSTTVGINRLVLVGIAVVLTAGLWLVYRFTRFGLAGSAVAENPLTASALGVSPDRVDLMNWIVGSALAGFAGALVATIIPIDPQTSSLIIVPALAAAVLGGFRSYPLTLLGGLAIGVIESELTNYVTAPGWAQSTGFLVIAVWLVVRGHGLPVRGHLTERLPRVGLPRRRGGALAFGLAFGFILIVAGSHTTQDSVSLSAAYGLICLSLVMLTGYAGQLSLAQFALAGVGALVAGRLSEAQHASFLVAAVCGIGAAMAAGIIFGLPALRTRGITLAVVTLGLGAAFQNIVLSNASYLGGDNGTTVGSVSLFGLSLDPIRHPGRFAAMTVIVFACAVFAISSVRRGGLGRQMIAVRDNERAAAALGIDVRRVKLTAFSVAAGLAALGGVLLAFHDPVIQFSQFNVLNSIGALVQTVIIGIGFLIGAVMAGLANPVGFPAQILHGVGNAADYVLLASGFLLLAGLVFAPDGAAARGHPLDPLLAIWDRHRPRRRRAATEATAAPKPIRVEPGDLTASGITVAFGGIVAVSDVSLSVKTGEIVGLIGPNGAGKTTLIDVLSGVTRHDGGTIRLSGRAIDGWRAHRRAHAGIGRSFQSLELFDDLTVRENLLVASDQASKRTGLRWPRRRSRTELNASALAAIDELGLFAFLDVQPTSMSAGQRRLVGIARAVAASPKILLLDEPAAGLDENETRELGRVVTSLAKDWGLGVILVEHDFSLVRAVCDRLVVLERGAVLAEGTTSEVVAREEVIAAFIGPAHHSAAADPVPTPQVSQ